MSPVIEIVGNVMVSAGVTFGAFFIKHRLKRRARNTDGTLPWSIYKTGGPTHGFRCPKCINANKNSAQPPFCECEEYHEGHFHFKCGDCGYQNLVRTADVP